MSTDAVSRVQNDQRGRLLEEPEHQRAGGGEKHQPLDPDLALLDELLKTLLREIPCADRNRGQQRNQRERLGRVEQLQQQPEAQQQPGQQGVAQRPEPVGRLAPAQSAGDLLLVAIGAHAARRPWPYLGQAPTVSAARSSTESAAPSSSPTVMLFPRRPTRAVLSARVMRAVMAG